MRATNEDGSIRFTKVKKDGVWYQFIGAFSDFVGTRKETIDVMKNLKTGELISRRRKTIQKTEYEDVDCEVVFIVKKDSKQLLKFYRKNYTTIGIINENKIS